MVALLVALLVAQVGRFEEWRMEGMMAISLLC